jgi:hypothetical protein
LNVNSAGALAGAGLALNNESESDMATQDTEEVIASTTRVCQILGGALIAGPLIFLGIAFAVAPILPPERAAGDVAVKEAQAAPKPRPLNPSLDLDQILTWAAVAFALVAATLSFVLPQLITARLRRGIAANDGVSQSRQNPDDDARARVDPRDSSTRALASIYQNQFIVASALLEGATFFALCVYMLGRNPIAIGIALLLLAAQLLQFPTRGRVASWFERQQEMLIDERR